MTNLLIALPAFAAGMLAVYGYLRFQKSPLIESIELLEEERKELKKQLEKLTDSYEDRMHYVSSRIGFADSELESKRKELVALDEKISNAKNDLLKETYRSKTRMYREGAKWD